MAGIYIHIPFCRQACTYCNFHFSTSVNLKEKLINAINKEISLSENFISDTNIETIYFGGGTPSLISIKELTSLISNIRDRFQIIKNAEITIEVNPDDINTKVLHEWQNAGINRLSIGIQSFDENELRWMNRAHNAQQSIDCIDEIKLAGFTNFSADLIYGSPLSTIKSFQYNTGIILEKNVPHISCYALTVEPKTKLDNMIKTFIPSR